MRYSIHPRKLFKAHDKDPKPVTARYAIRNTLCIHCYNRYLLGEKATYTQLSNMKIIWWHSDPSCVPDDEII